MTQGNGQKCGTNAGALRAQKSREREMAIRKPTESGKRGAPGGDCPDNDWLEQYPTVSEYLGATTYADGSKRDTSTLTVFLESGSLKVALNDRDLSRSIYVTSDTFSRAMEQMEKALNEKDADWRPWKGAKKK
jgi:hypothetical protein